MMSDWNMVQLESLLEVGVSYGIVQPGNHDSSGVPIIRVKDVKDGVINSSNPLRVSQEIEGKYSRTRLCGGEVLLTLVGSVGEVAVASRTLQGWNVARAIAVLRVKPEISPHWVKICIEHGAAQQFIKDRLNTTVQATLNLKDARILPIPLPPQSVRDGILELVGALDDKIAVNERLAVTIEHILSLKFEQLGVVGADVDGLAPVSELIDFNPKEPIPKVSSAPYIDMSALATDQARIKSVGEREPKSGAKFKNGDTLLARITPCLENGKTGYVDSLPEGEIGIGSTEFIVMRSKAGIPKELPYFIARNDSFRDHAIRNMEGTSGRQRVAAKNIADFPVKMPDIDALKNFGEESERSFRYMKALGKESRSLAELRDTLLPRLMSGELRVKDAERIAEEAI